MSNLRTWRDLTIIVSSYNCAKYLPCTLNSIFAQTVLPKEVIVVDDAATDNSNDIIRQYQQKHNNIQLISNDINRGVIFTVNRGFNIAQTKYVMSLAADDWILPTFIEESMEIMTRYPQAGLCSTGSLIAIENKNNALKLASMPRPLKTAGYISPEEATRKLIRYDSWFMGNSVIMNLDMLLQLGSYRENLTSFSDNFLYRQLSLKYGCCFIPKPLSVWRIRELGYSQSTCRSIAQLTNIMLNYSDLMEHQFADLFPPIMVKKELKRWSFKLSKILINYQTESHAKKIINKFMACILFAYMRPFDVGPFIARKITPGIR